MSYTAGKGAGVDDLVWCFLRLGLGLFQTGIVVELIALWVVGLQGWILVLCSIFAGLFLVFWLNAAALSSCEVLNILPLYQKWFLFLPGMTAAV